MNTNAQINKRLKEATQEQYAYFVNQLQLCARMAKTGVAEPDVSTQAGLAAADFGLSETQSSADNLKAAEGALKGSAAAAARESNAVLAELLSSLSRKAAKESALEIKQNVTGELRDELLRHRSVNDDLDKRILTLARDKFGSDNFDASLKLKIKQTAEAV